MDIKETNSVFDIPLTGVQNVTNCDNSDVTNPKCFTYNTWDPGIMADTNDPEANGMNSFEYLEDAPESQSMGSFYHILHTTSSPSALSSISPSPQPPPLFPVNSSFSDTSVLALTTAASPIQSLWQSSANNWHVLPLSLIVLAGITGEHIH